MKNFRVRVLAIVLSAAASVPAAAHPSETDGVSHVGVKSTLTVLEDINIPPRKKRISVGYSDNIGTGRHGISQCWLVLDADSERDRNMPASTVLTIEKVGNPVAEKASGVYSWRAADVHTILSLDIPARLDCVQGYLNYYVDDALLNPAEWEMPLGGFLAATQGHFSLRFAAPEPMTPSAPKAQPPRSLESMKSAPKEGSDLWK